MKKGHIYLIAPEAALHRSDINVVKIGFTRGNPLARLASLQTGSPAPLRLWAYFDGTEELERAFHRTFAELHSHGEWFLIEYKLADFMHYLGEEPHIGHYVPEERLEVALYDVVFSKFPPHPSVPEDAWLRSAEPEHLRAFFPDIWEEINA